LKSLTEHLWFEVPERRGFINITPKIAELVSQSGVREGLCLVNAMHITASVFINDDESGLHHDYEVWLEKLAPHAPTSAYRHNRTGEDNADAHLKRQIMGREVVVAITKGKLDLACPAVAPAKEEPVGTNLLRRIRRSPPKTRARENYRRVEGLDRGGIIKL
jgi:secondary thiamine-phosphate synthase enzyme